VIALDTNILVYAHRTDAELHRPAAETVVGLAAGRDPWALPWPVAHEFLRLVTGERVSPPTPREVAIRQLDSLLSARTTVPIGESREHWRRLRGLLDAGAVGGRMVYDARIAAICLEHGVRELWTADRDFGRFPALRTRNPLVG